MKRIILAIAVICVSLQSLSAQKKSEGSDSYRYYKAIELINEQGFVDEAMQLLVDNLEENPGHILSYLPIISAYMERGNYNDALTMVNLAMRNNHKNSDVSDARLLWWKADIYKDMGRIDDAIELMEIALKKGKKSNEEGLEEFQKALAQMYYDAGRYNESDRVYQELLKVNKDSRLAMVGISRNLIARGRYEDALEVLDICKSFDASYHEIYRFQMQGYVGTKEYKKAIDAMLVYYEMTEDVDYIYYDLFKKSKSYSIAVLKQKIVSNADNISWKYILAELYSQLDMDLEAIALYNQMIDQYGALPTLLKDRIVAFGALGLTDLALADIEVALADSDSESLEELYLLRSAIYADSRDYSKALDDLDLFVEKYPTYAVGYYYRGLYNLYAGNYPAAISAFSDGIEIDETYSSNYLLRGCTYLLMGQRENALFDFEQILRLTSEPCEDRAYALFHVGRTREAIDCIHSMIADEPYENGHHFILAALYSLMNKGKEAVAALQVAFEMGYKDFNHILRSKDLDNIRDREDFKALVQKYQDLLKVDVEKVYEMLKPKQTERGNATPVYSEIPMKKQYGGTYEVPCVVNGLPLMMIFDTGAADVTISTVEASFMFKNGYLKESDIKGSRNYVTADGGVHAGTVITLKEVKLGEAVLKNVQASVVHNQKAPLLLGQSVLEKFGTITIDNVNLKITIQQ